MPKGKLIIMISHKQNMLFLSSKLRILFLKETRLCLPVGGSKNRPGRGQLIAGNALYDSSQSVRQPKAGHVAGRSEAFHQPLLGKGRAGPPGCRGSRRAERASRPHHQGPAGQGRPENVVWRRREGVALTCTMSCLNPKGSSVDHTTWWS